MLLDLVGPSRGEGAGLALTLNFNLALAWSYMGGVSSFQVALCHSLVQFNLLGGVWFQVPGGLGHLVPASLQP